MATTSDVAETSTAASSFQEGSLLGFPRGVLLVCFAEVCERFSYYGLMAILGLYVSATVQNGGFGWPDQSALQLYGLYAGLAFASPVVGGIVGVFIGERRCILLGGILIVLGHLLIALPWLVSLASQQLFGLDLLQLLRDLGTPLGYLFDSEPLKLVREGAAREGVSGNVAAGAYLLTSISFFAGLAGIITGTALFKPTISSIVGRFYDVKDPRRDSAYALLMLGIFVAQILSVVTVGLLGEHVDWHLGFGAAGMSMALGLLVYMSLQQRLIGNVGVAPESRRARAPKAALTVAELDRVKVIVCITLFVAAFCVVAFQSGLFILFAKLHVDRARWGWQLPASWFPLIGSVGFMLAAPILAWLWERLASRGRQIRTSTKLVFGLGIAGVAHLIVAFPMLIVSGPDDTMVSPMWLLATYLLFGIAEAFVWAGVFSLTTRLAPERFAALFVGGIYLAMGTGVWGGTYVGTFGFSGGMGNVLLFYAMFSFVAAGLLWTVRGRLAVLTHSLEP